MEPKRPPAKSFKDLIAWQKAHELVLGVYSITRNFPKEEMFVLTSQIRRSAISVAANIAEGFKRASAPDKVRMLNIAQGSLSETEYFLMLSQDLNYGTTNDLMNKANEVGKLVESYKKALKK